MQFRNSLVMIVTIGVATIAGTALPQSYPSKSIHVVTSAAGGSADIVSRLIAQSVSGSLGQQMIVDNRSGVIAGEIVAKSPGDGYTLLVSGNLLWLSPFLEKVSYDPVKDFSPITLAANTPNMIVVHPSLPIKSVKELIALAKARPGELNYAAAAPGSTNHLGGELFKSMAGVNIVGVNYKGGGPALNDLIGGQVQLMFATAASVTPHVKSGRLRALAVTSAKPSALLPGLPTASASGLPGYYFEVVLAVLAAANTPAAIVNRLNQEIVQALNKPEAKERFFTSGLEVVGSSPDALMTEIKSDMARMGKVIKDAGIRAQ